MKIKVPQKIFFGWWIIIVTSAISAFTMVFAGQGASVLFKPIAADLALDRTAVSVATGIGTLVNGFIFAFSGWLSVKFGPKWIILAGACLTGIGISLMWFVSSAFSYYLVWGVILVTGNALGFSVTIDVMLTNWFVRKRGLAFSVKWGIISLVVVALLPLLSWLVEVHGWRMTSLIWGISSLALTPLLMYFVKQKRPEYYGMLPDGASPQPGTGAGVATMVAAGQQYAAGIQETEFTFKQAAGTSAYWMINAGWALACIIMGGFNLHIVPFLTDKGIDPITAGSLLAMMVLFTTPSRIFGGIIADRIKKERLKFLLAGSFFLASAALTVSLFYHGMVGTYILLILYGLGYGAYTPLDTLVRGRFFGRKAYGSIQGVCMLITAPLSFLAPIYAGWVYDMTGTYTTAFTLFAVLAAAGGFIMCLIRVPGLSPVNSK